MDKNILKLKLLLEQELKDLNWKKYNKEGFKLNVEILNNVILTYGNGIDIQSLINKEFSILLCLDTVFGKNSMYSEEFLKNICWLKMYKNEIDELEEYQDRVDNLLEIKKKLEECSLENEIILDEIKQMEEESKNGFDKIKMIKHLLDILKYNQLIQDKELEYIYDFLNVKNIDQKEIIYILESINKSNFAIKKVILNNSKLKFDNTIIEMLNLGFEYYPKIRIDKIKENSIILKAKGIINSLQAYYNIGNHEFDFKVLEFNKDVYSINEYRAFYHIIMNVIQDKLLGIISLIQEKEFYFDKETKIEILKEYNNLLDIYCNIKTYMEKQILDNTNLKEEKEQQIVDSSINKNHLLFIKRSDGTFFEKDLKDVPKEYLQKVLYLLNNFSLNKLSNSQIRHLSSASAFSDYFELKDDQVRICVQHIFENYYNIKGVGVKKSNCDNKLLEKMCDRPDISELKIDLYLENEQEEFDRINEYLENNKRRGNR